jgi:hypothetical protein
MTKRLVFVIMLSECLRGDISFQRYQTDLDANPFLLGRDIAEDIAAVLKKHGGSANEGVSRAWIATDSHHPQARAPSCQSLHLAQRPGRFSECPASPDPVPNAISFSTAALRRWRPVWE